MASPTFFGDGHTPAVKDTEWRINQKILGALVDDAGGGGFPLLTGIGSPQGVVVAAGAGQRYWDTDGGAFYTNVDGTVNGWNVG